MVLPCFLQTLYPFFKSSFIFIISFRQLLLTLIVSFVSFVSFKLLCGFKIWLSFFSIMFINVLDGFYSLFIFLQSFLSNFYQFHLFVPIFLLPLFDVNLLCFWSSFVNFFNNRISISLNMLYRWIY